jgi:hypothetical protein
LANTVTASGASALFALINRKGNAQKEAMTAVARARFGFDLYDNAADALWASAYALDHNLFG